MVEDEELYKRRVWREAYEQIDRERRQSIQRHMIAVGCQRYRSADALARWGSHPIYRWAGRIMRRMYRKYAN